MASHKTVSRGLPRGRKGGITKGSGNVGGGVTITGGVQLGGQGPAVVQPRGSGQSNRSANTPGRTSNKRGSAIRSTPGRTVSGTNRTLPS